MSDELQMTFFYFIFWLKENTPLGRDIIASEASSVRRIDIKEVLNCRHVTRELPEVFAESRRLVATWGA